MQLYHPPEVIDPRGLAAACQELITEAPHFTQWDYQLYTSINATSEPGTPPSAEYLTGKVREEVNENLDAVAEDDTDHAIEEFGDASWCLHALASSLDINMAYYTSWLLDWAQSRVRYPHPIARAATLQSLDNYDALQQYQPMRLPYVPRWTKSWDRPLPVSPSVDLRAHFVSNIDTITSTARLLAEESSQLKKSGEYQTVRNVLGCTAGDMWLCLGKVTRQAAGRPIVVEALSLNIAKINDRVARNYNFSLHNR